MTPRTFAQLIAALAVMASACHPSDPQTTTATAAAPKRPPSAARDEGEELAGVAGAHRIGTPGPAMTVTTIDGKTIDLAKLYDGKPVYLKFWATWCIPCRKQMPGFEHIYETLGDRINVIAVDAGFNDDEAAVRAFREQYGLHMPIVVDDGRLAAALDLQVTPQHVVIGRDARIAYVGHHDGDRLDAALQKVLSEPDHGPATGQPLTLRPAFRPGERVETLEATTLDGAVVSLGKSRDGRPRGVVLFSTWCESYLEHSQPQTSQACRRVREDVDRLVASGELDWLGVAGGPWSTTEDLAEYKAKTGTKLPLALDADGALFRAFGVRQIPAIALIDPDGRLVRVLGPGDRDLDAAVRTLRLHR